MKRTLAVLTIFLAFAGTALAGQTFDGKKIEIGAGLSFESISGSGSTSNALNIPVRAGYFVWKGLEIEPEFLLNAVSRDELGWMVNGNVAYNFRLKNRGFVPFVLAGVGFGNGLEVAGAMLNRGHGRKVHGINAGAGVKCLITGDVAFRVEYRYGRNTLKQDSDPETKFDSHRVLCGISVFF